MLQALDKLLIQNGLITELDATRARDVQRTHGGDLSDILIRLGAIGEEDLLRARANVLGIGILDPTDLPTDLADCTSAMEALGPIDWWLRHSAICWHRKTDGVLVCVARDPVSAELGEMLQTEPTVTYYLVRSKDLDWILQAVRDFGRLGGMDFGAGVVNSRDLGEDAPTIEFINKIMSQAVYANASDIHIEPGEHSFTVRFRIDGVLTEHTTQSRDRVEAVTSRIKLMSGLDIAERRLPQDGRQTVRAAGKLFDLRVSTLPGVFGESVVIRLLPKQQESLSLTKLGFRAQPLDTLRTIAHQPNGIFLVTGPTGSGKSTTLHAAISEIKDGRRKIITVEDPVEYNSEGITQVQVKSEIGLTFAATLRSILRQDPDVIMIGEIRDRETAEIAVQSALTGHMVFSTLHTNNAIGAVTRLLNMGLEPFLLGAALQGMMAQRLVRRVCPACARPAPTPPESAAYQHRLREWLGSEMPRWLTAVGCPQCGGTGYRGRRGVFELVRMTPDLRQAIITGQNEAALMEIARKDGASTLAEDAVYKAATGVTTIEEAARVIGDIEASTEVEGAQ